MKSEASGPAKASAIRRWALCLVLAASCGGVALAQEAGTEGRFGGVLNVALPAEPETLDNSFTTSGIANVVSQHVVEPLFAFDQRFVPQPLLVESYEVSEDGTSYVFSLRQGLTFHDGSALDARDVVDSLERWMRLSVRGSVAAAVFEGMEATDDLTVRIDFTEPFAPFLSLLALTVGGPVIFPSEIVAKYPDGPIQEIVGTGPYRLEEYLPGRYVSVTRFDGYQPREEPGDGLAGARIAYFDEIRFHWVPDALTRAAGVQTSEYQFATDIVPDTYADLDRDERVETVIIKPERWLIFMLNKRAGLMTDLGMRRAFNAALDMEEMLTAAGGDPTFWQLNHNYMVGDTPWLTDAGSDRYNIGDPELARRLAEEAGYDGQPIRWLVAGERQDHFLATQVAVAQLEAAGFNVDLQVVDTATLYERRASPEVWDVFTTQGAFIPDPVLLTVITDTYFGWWVDDTRAGLFRDLNTALTLEERQAIWEDMQDYIYDQIPSVFVGELFGLALKSPDLQGYTVMSNNHFFWNTWLE